MNTGNTTFVILCFEGPDRYSRAGGLGSRTNELSLALSAMGFYTHLFFIGDPLEPPVESREGGRLTLHRWSQWISKYYPKGAYDGQEEKIKDWTASIPQWLENNLFEEVINAGGDVVVLAEEWQTADSMIELKKIIDRRGWEHDAFLFWNMNNPFGTEHVLWAELDRSAVITTVSRFMKQLMWRYGVDARVVPNGIGENWFDRPEESDVSALRTKTSGRTTFAKIARWDPDKRWLMAVDTIAEMKSSGDRPLLLARGGLEPHGDEVLTHVKSLGLKLNRISLQSTEPQALIDAIPSDQDADILLVDGFLNQPQLKVLYSGADVVLANSGVEPFGLVGLEVMACGGVAFIGATGEDYATPGFDCIAIQTGDPREIAYHARFLNTFDESERLIRTQARNTARRYTWIGIINRVLMPMIDEILGVQPSPAFGEPVRPPLAVAIEAAEQK